MSLDLVKSIFYWFVNLGLPVGGVALNYLFRAPRNLPLTYGSDLLLALVFGDLALAVSSAQLVQILATHPYKTLILDALVTFAVVSMLGWAIVIRYFEESFEAEGSSTVTRKHFWAWLLVGAIFALHLIFFFGPKSAEGAKGVDAPVEQIT